MNLTKLTRRVMAVIWASAFFATGSFAQTSAPFPNKPVRIVVPFAAGGPNDVMARVVALQLSASTGQSFVVENKAGAGGIIGTDAVAKSTPDGYTLAFISGPFTMAPALQSKMPYDTLKDLVPIIKVAESPMVMMVPSSTKFKNAQELLQFAKANPTTLNYGSGGIGSTPHLTTELLGAVTGAKFTHVPYKGGGDSIKGLMGAEIDLLIDSITSTEGPIASGKVKAVAVGLPKRLFKWPDVPTFGEVGVPKFGVTHWVGIVSPAKTPPDVVSALHGLISSALKSPSVVQKLRDMGAEPVGGSSPEFGKFISDEIVNWQQIVKAASIQAQ